MAEKVTERADIVYDELGRLYPEAKCELKYVRQIDLLVAVMLSAQTTDAAVNAATPLLFARYPDATAYAIAPEGEIEETIRHLGLFRAKAKHIRSAAAIIAADGGIIPNDQAYLERLPGVGRKTANVFLSEWYHVPRIAVDTHVGRVAYRLGFAPKGDDPGRTEQRLMDAFPMERWSDLHHKLIFFGRYFCTARKPSCAVCPFVGLCVEPRL